MPVYEEMVKDKTGKLVPKLIDRQKVYYIRTYITDEFGKRKQITRHNKNWIGIDGKREATAEENKLVNKKYNQYENMTLNELFDAYFKYIEKNLKPSSISKIKDNYNLHIKQFLGFKKILELSTKDILEFHECLNQKTNEIKTKNSKRNVENYKLSISFKRAIHITLVTILNFGCKYYGLDKNVASIVGNFQSPKGTKKKEMNYLTYDEFSHFIENEQNIIYKDFFTIMFYTGMRRGELLALTIKDIDFENKKISINKSINPKNGINSTVPKTNRSNRNIKALEIVINIFKKYISEEKEIFGLDKIKLTTLQRKCDNNCIMANINKNIRIHDFRHSFASMCINNNIPIQIISGYLGHENISTTLDIYGHLYPNSETELVDKITNFIAKQDQKQD